MIEAGLDCIAIQSLGHDTALGARLGVQADAGATGAQARAGVRACGARGRLSERAREA